MLSGIHSERSRKGEHRMADSPGQSGRVEYKAVVHGTPEEIANALTQLSHEGWQPFSDVVVHQRRFVVFVSRPVFGQVGTVPISGF
jgi:hypothetical protein